MYSRTILPAAASVVGAAPVRGPHQAAAGRGLVSASLHLSHHRLLSDPHFAGGHHAARAIDLSGRVVPVEVDPGAAIGKILI